MDTLVYLGGLGAFANLLKNDSKLISVRFCFTQNLRNCAHNLNILDTLRKAPPQRKIPVMLVLLCLKKQTIWNLKLPWSSSKSSILIKFRCISYTKFFAYPRRSYLDVDHFGASSVTLSFKSKRRMAVLSKINAVRAPNMYLIVQARDFSNEIGLKGIYH